MKFESSTTKILAIAVLSGLGARQALPSRLCSSTAKAGLVAIKMGHGHPSTSKIRRHVLGAAVKKIDSALLCHRRLALSSAVVAEDFPALALLPIGIARSPYSQKFGIPRQGNLALDAETRIDFDPQRVDPSALRGLGEVSHVWVLFWFHGLVAPQVASTVRPPRLGGNTHLGCFATRSPFRPNPIGMSALEIVEIGEMHLRLRGGDLVDGTPIVDVKPYVPFSDCLPQARHSWASEAPQPLRTQMMRDIQEQCEQSPALARQVASALDALRWDPRPAYHDDDPQRLYGAHFGSLNLRFRIVNDVLELVEVNERHCDT